MGRHAVISVFLISALSLGEIACQTTGEIGAGSSALYPTIKEGCDYRERKAKLRKELQAEVLAKNRAENDVKDELTDKTLDFYANHSLKIIELCQREAVNIGGEEGDYYRRWCNSFEPRLLVPAYRIWVVFVKHVHQHMAVLGWRETNNTISWHCGATLIHKDFILTAAHCIFNRGTPPDLVRMAEVNLLQGGPTMNTVDYDIEKIVTHEQYNSDEYYNDIALMKIKRQAAFKDIQPPLPACIWTERDYPTTRLTALGFGAPSFGQVYTLVLKVNNLTYFDRAECSNFFENVAELPSGVLESQLCALDPTGLSDTCEGDSGGPLQINLMDEFETPYLVGITSFGPQCFSGNPGVYTRVYGYLDWIEKNLKEMM